jgi:hypothetical protein
MEKANTGKFVAKGERRPISTPLEVGRDAEDNQEDSVEERLERGTN